MEQWLVVIMVCNLGGNDIQEFLGLCEGLG